MSDMVNDTSQKISRRVNGIVDRHSRGDLEHVREALSLLWNTANQPGGTITPPNNQPPVCPLTIPFGFRS